MTDAPKTTRRSGLHVIRTGMGGWMVRLAISVLPPGDSRETLRMACLVWLRLMDVRIKEMEQAVTDAPKTTTTDAAWQALVDAAKGWAPHLDQWDKFKFATDYGPVYVTIGRGSEHPSTFEEVP